MLQSCFSAGNTLRVTFNVGFSPHIAFCDTGPRAILFLWRGHNLVLCFLSRPHGLWQTPNRISYGFLSLTSFLVTTFHDELESKSICLIIMLWIDYSTWAVVTNALLVVPWPVCRFKWAAFSSWICCCTLFQLCFVRYFGGLNRTRLFIPCLPQQTHPRFKITVWTLLYLPITCYPSKVYSCL